PPRVPCGVGARQPVADDRALERDHRTAVGERVAGLVVHQHGRIPLETASGDQLLTGRSNARRTSSIASSCPTPNARIASAYAAAASLAARSPPSPFTTVPLRPRVVTTPECSSSRYARATVFVATP